MKMKYFNEIFFWDFVGLSNFECPDGGRGGGGGKGGGGLPPARLK